jgi:hypothetical protein
MNRFAATISRESIHAIGRPFRKFAVEKGILT